MSDKQSIDSIFCSAIEIESPDERRALVEAACGDDVELKNQVERLLHAHYHGRSILDAPARPVATVDETLGETAGAVIGPYKLLEQIGEGGMGTVWMADQKEPIHRRVAVKVIKAGMNSKQVLARFEAERQALALMDHPNIARVLDAGTTDAGRPYFVMELVKGTPITTYCDDKHLTVRQRLEMLGDVCRAVQHAHQKGIIHRDLKPSNILIAPFDGKPMVKVIDFGVAKATGQRLTDASLFTGFGAVVGTPEYMSPEQAETNNQDIDTRSDIYSLGVLLYELLTGSTPLTKKRVKEAALLEVLRVIREEEPPRPSTRLSSTDGLPSISAQRQTEPAKLTRLVRGELDWIVMKTLEKDRNRRYETANGFAADVQRYLAGEQVLACPPSAWYRLRKFGRRNKMALIMLASVAVTLLIGTIVSTWQAIRATRAEDLAQTRLDAESAALVRAKAEASRANAISEFLQEALYSANPDSSKGADYTVRQLLDDLSQGLGERLKDQPETEATIHATIGNAYRALGLTQSAKGHLDKALEIRRRVFGPNDITVAQSHLDWAMNSFESGNRIAAEAETREALTIFQIGNAKDEKILATLHYLAFVLGHQGKFAEQQTVAEQALAFARDKGLADSPIVASLLHNLGHTRIETGDYAGAESLLLKAVHMHRRLHGKEHVETGWALLNLGVARERQKKLGEAEANMRDALNIFRKHFVETHKSILLTSDALQRVLISKNDKAGLAAFHVERAARLNKALELQLGNLGLRIQLGKLLRDGKDYDGAHAQFSEVIAKDPKFVDAWVGCGECDMWRGNFAKAVEEFSTAIKLNPQHAHAWSCRAWAQFNLRQWDNAVSDYSKAIELTPKVHTNWFHRGMAYLELGESDKAAADFTKVVEGWPNEAEGWYLRALAYSQSGQPDKALADLRQAIAAGFRNVGRLKNDPKLAPLRSNDEFKKLVAELEAKK